MHYQGLMTFAEIKVLSEQLQRIASGNWTRDDLERMVAGRWIHVESRNGELRVTLTKAGQAVIVNSVQILTMGTGK